MKSQLLLSFGAVAASLLVASSPARAQAPGYHVIHKIAAGGEGGWDYITVDTAGNRLFLSRGSHAMVIDLGRDSVIGDIPNTPGIHGVALAPELNRGFTTNGRDSSVTIFDYKTRAPIMTVKIPARNPDAILYDPATKRLFTFNGGTANSTAIDATNGSVIGNVDLGGKPESAVSEGGEIYAVTADFGPTPAPTADRPRLRAPMIPGSFVVLELDR